MSDGGYAFPAWMNESVIAVAVFVATQVIAFLIYRRAVRHRERDLMIGLIIEISYNHSQLSQFLYELPSEHEFLRKMQSLQIKRPHWNYAHHAHFYQSNLGHLVLNPPLMKKVIELYNGFDSIKADIQSLQFSSFMEITHEGREWFLSSIWDDMRKVAAECRATLYQIELEYADDWKRAVRLREDEGLVASQNSTASMTNLKVG